MHAICQSHANAADRFQPNGIFERSSSSNSFVLARLGLVMQSSAGVCSCGMSMASGGEETLLKANKSGFG
jgi:hypothetical protein